MRPRKLTKHMASAMRYMKHQNPRLTHRELASLLGVDRSTVTNHLNAMPPYEESHIIENVPSGINKIIEIETRRIAA